MARGKPAETRPDRSRSFRANGPLLRSLRLARGWTQQEAAARSGMTDRLIRKAEAGQPLQLNSLSLLAQLYGTPLAPLTVEQLLAGPLGDLLNDAPDGEALVRRWFDEVWNQGRLETIDELTTPESVLRADCAVLRGPAEIRRRTESIRAAFSDFDLRLDHVAVQGEWVMSRWRATMAHTGDWMGGTPTNQRLELYGSTWIRIENGLFMEAWDYWQCPQTTEVVNRRKTTTTRRGGKRQTRKRR